MTHQLRTVVPEIPPARMVRGVIIASSVLLTGVVIHWALVPGADWSYFYYPTVTNYFAGKTPLYDSYTQGFYNPPWTVLLMAPFVAFGPHLGMTLFRLFTLYTFAAIAYVFAPTKQRMLVVALAMACFYTWDSIGAANVEVFVLLGVTMIFFGLQRRNPWLLGGGLVLAAVKFQMVLLIGLGALMYLRFWPRRLVAMAFVLPVATLLLSFAMSGLDWPLRWLQHIQIDPPLESQMATIYRAARMVGVPLAPVALGALALALWSVVTLWRRGLDRFGLAWAAAANAVISPYMLARNFPLLMLISWTWLAGRSWPLALASYAFTFLPVLRNVYGREVTWIDSLFPIVLTAAIWWASRGASSATAAQPDAHGPP